MRQQVAKEQLIQNRRGSPGSPQQKRTTSVHFLSPGERKRFMWTAIATVLLILAASVSSKASELSPDTVSTWDDYIRAQTARVAGSSHGDSFLWSGQSPDRIRRLRAGEILVLPMGENPKTVPHGLIH